VTTAGAAQPDRLDTTVGAAQPGGPETTAGAAQHSGAAQPLASVILVNYRSAADTLACVQAVYELDWPVDALEVVVVDNASSDGSSERIRAEAPGVLLIEAGTNLGFAGGCNLGARSAHGAYLAFINNDARPDPAFLRAAVPVLQADPSVGCVAARVLDWEGRTVDFVGGSLAWYGYGFKDDVGLPAAGRGTTGRDVLFPTGSGMVVRAEAFAGAGGFDERYFLFFEDVDLGWRLWLLGHRVRYVPGAVVYHRHHATVGRYGRWREEYLLARNALATMYKNYGDEALAALLPGALALTVQRGIAAGGDDPSVLDLQRHAGGEDRDTATVAKSTLAGAYAVSGFLELLPSLAASRRELQARRVRRDEEVLPLFGHPLRPDTEEPGFAAAYEAVREVMAVEAQFSPRRRVVVATADALGRAQAGPAIRAWHLAAALAGEHEVQLVTTSPHADLADDRFRIRSVTGPRLAALGRWADVVVVQGDLLSKYPGLATTPAVVVVDLYDPYHLEQLEQARDLGPARRADVVRAATAALNDSLLRGDFFLCASGKQRDFWLGQLAALGRVNPHTYDEDETLGSLLAVVPFGVEESPPVRRRPAVKGVLPGVGEHDELLLWGGGVYNWFDPLTLIEAVGRLAARRPTVRLLFLGMRHPNPDVPEMRMATAARERAAELGLTGSVVHFNETWVPYDERADYLLEADVGVSTHLDHVETAFSFRTRVLDYLWAGLPVVTTRGDALAELVQARGLGLTVPPGDVAALESALERLLTDAELVASCRRAAAELVPELVWSRAVQPLVTFVRAARRAPDLLDRATVSALRQPVRARPPRARQLVARAVRARDLARSEGVGELGRRVASRVGARAGARLAAARASRRPLDPAGPPEG